MSRGASFISKTAALARKDLRVEARGRDTLPPMVAFTLAVALLLAFTIPPTSGLRAPVETPFGAVALADVLSGFMWVTVLFAGLIGFARTFEVEREEGALDPLLLAPLDRSGLFLAKAGANLVFVAVVQGLSFLAFALLFSLDLGERWLALALVAALADIGFVASGTLFAALAAHTRSRELILPILALPALVPVFIAATELTGDLLSGRALSEIGARGWVGILVAFDLISVTIGILGFDYVLE